MTYRRTSRIITGARERDGWHQSTKAMRRLARAFSPLAAAHLGEAPRIRPKSAKAEGLLPPNIRLIIMVPGVPSKWDMSSQYLWSSATSGGELKSQSGV